jgi:hypothetical protein
MDKLKAAATHYESRRLLLPVVCEATFMASVLLPANLLVLFIYCLARAT